MRILVTGCCGFIGSNFVKFILSEKPDWKIVNLDLLTYAGNRQNLQVEDENPNYNFIWGNICSQKDITKAIKLLGDVEAIVNFAAESHVDNSIKNPNVFVDTNVQGTLTLLNEAKERKIKFLQISTDEVYGSLGKEGLFTESSNINPNSPYSASKASADLLVRAFHETYGLNTNITRCSNNYGPYQFPEKLIPLVVSNLIQNKKIPVYGDGLNVRDWLHVEDHCRAILNVLENGVSGEVYNIGGFNEHTNLDIIKTILDIMNKTEECIEFVPDRLGHDRRYAIDSSKITKELGWVPKYSFENGIEKTVEWYQENVSWWTPLKRLTKL